MHYKFQRLTEPATLLKVTLLHGCFPRILNCTNGTKTRKTSHIIFRYLKRRTGQGINQLIFKLNSPVTANGSTFILFESIPSPVT